ncbi:glycosyltransferase [Streptomyces arboris]|uniref:Glycosyltransferase n=1 Tax=Streptomyces arboris TaxID=2600619 RepID=A0A5N5EW18_9ACTN|nr:glycosyltransferase [Streptomyces arboris]KAB2594181.1 glycosyltransferase [Streptomyces arboris]
MTHVLLIAGTRPQAAVLKASLEKFRAAGATVELAGLFAPDDIDPGLELTRLRSLTEAAAERGRTFEKRVAKLSAPRRVWASAERDRQVRGSGRRAHVLVALDATAVYTVWRLAQINRRAHAVFGIAPALKAVQDRHERPLHYALRAVTRSVPTPATAARTTQRAARRVAGGALRRASSPAVLRTSLGAKSWRGVVAAPKMPDRLRAKLARRISLSMTEGGRRAGATLVLKDAARLTADRALRADLLAEAARADLERGHDDAALRRSAYEAALTTADRWYAKGDAKKAAASLSSALTLAFPRAVHFDSLTSPLAEDPAGYLAPFRASTAFQAMTAPRGRAVPAAAPPAGRPLRLLVTTYSNANFLQSIRDRYAGHPGVEIRFLEVKEDETLRPLARGAQRMMEYALGGRPGLGDQAEQALRPHLDWADTVFVDWCTNAAALFTLVDPGTTRIVVRLHSYEAFTLWPHLMDLDRVDDLVFVGDHLRDLVADCLPRLREPGAPALHVIANAMDLKRFRQEKTGGDTRFTVGLIGAGVVAKDPRWAVEVLRLLREHDERYRLVVIGSGLDRKASAAARAYDDLLQRDLAELEPTGAVRLLGRTEDVPGALTGVGVILSSSVRESFHCGLVEGAASGALPVVRDWPFFAGKEHSARTLFPADWVVGSPGEAADRILALTATEETWRKASAEAAEHALTTWDWPVISPAFDRLLLEG